MAPEKIGQSDPNRTLSKIFRSYDVRGIYPSEINEQVAERIGRAYVKLFSANPPKQIIVSHDVRNGSPGLALAFINGIASSSDLKVIFAGMLPIGAAHYHASKTGSQLVYITASHLPKEWNGIKFYNPSGAGWNESKNFELRDIFLSLPEASQPAKARHIVIDPETIAANYIRSISAKIKPKRRMRVVLDCGNGATSMVAPRLFAFGGFDVKALWAEADGNFPNRPSDPQSESLQRLKEAVKSERASLGIAYDGDGDRMAIVDDAGCMLAPERAAYFMLSELLPKVKGPVVANVECTRLVDDIAKKFGCQVIRVPVGHTNLTEAIHANNAVFGVESSGDYVLPALTPFDDGLAVSYYLACLLAGKEESLSSIASKIPAYPSERVNFVCADEEKFQVIDRLKLKLSKAYNNINTMDGLRIDMPDGWVLIRASNTEPKIRLTVEANTHARLSELKEEFADMLNSELGGVYKPSLLARIASIFGKKGRLW